MSRSIFKIQSYVDDLYLALEDEMLWHPRLELPQQDDNNGVTANMRNESAEVVVKLFSLKDYPTNEIMFRAINFLDNVLSKFRVRATYVESLAVASFVVSCQYQCSLLTPNIEHVLTLFHNCCTVERVEKMISVIKKSLKIRYENPPPTTAFHSLEAFYNILITLDKHNILNSLFNFQEVMFMLIMVVCDMKYCQYRPSELALLVVCLTVETGLGKFKSPPPTIAINSIINNIDTIRSKLKISDETFVDCYKLVIEIVTTINKSLISNRKNITWKPIKRISKNKRFSNNRPMDIPETILEDGHSEISIEEWFNSPEEKPTNETNEESSSP